MNPLEKADATTNWREHIAPDGRKFFYNKVMNTSQWQMPLEVKNARINIMQNTETKILMDFDNSKTTPPEFVQSPLQLLDSSLSLNNNMSETVIYANKEEARESFKCMLNELGVNWRAAWEQALKIIINDFRYTNAIKSLNERKLVFIEWSKQKERKEREEIREK